MRKTTKNGSFEPFFVTLAAPGAGALHVGTLSGAMHLQYFQNLIL
jgi:hypothetical protein